MNFESSCAATSATRSVPEVRLGEVIRDSPPWASTASAIRSSSVATITRETNLARDALSTTCIIIGILAKRRRGLPGNLVEEYRAGMIATASPFTGFHISATLQGLSNDQAVPGLTLTKPFTCFMVGENRVWLTPFSASLGSSRLPEVD